MLKIRSIGQAVQKLSSGYTHRQTQRQTDRGKTFTYPHMQAVKINTGDHKHPLNPLSPMAHTYVTLEAHATALWHVIMYVTLKVHATALCHIHM